jgi:hypothetical protein
VVSAAEQRRRWAYRLISRCATPGPAYGSPEWLALPDGPEKVAAVVRAAECWATEGDDLLENLRAEIELSQAALKATEDADYIASRDAHRADWTGGGFRPNAGLPDELDREWAKWVGGEVA